MLGNDDATAERIAALFAGVGITAGDVAPWNAYPRYINKSPTAAQLKAGVAPMAVLSALLSILRVVMLHGGSAKNTWTRLTRRYRSFEEDRGLTAIATYHTSRQAFWHPDPSERMRRAAHLTEAFKQASDVLRSFGVNSGRVT